MFNLRWRSLGQRPRFAGIVRGFPKGSGSIILLESAKQFGNHIALDNEPDGLRYEIRFPLSTTDCKVSGAPTFQALAYNVGPQQVIRKARFIVTGSLVNSRGCLLTAVHCLSHFAPRRRMIQRQKCSILQLFWIALSFHRQMEDASREFFWPNVVMAVSSERYPRFIKCGFHDHEGLGIKRAIAKSMHVSPPTIEVAMKHCSLHLRLVYIAQLNRATWEK
jgi:hypothetical protein